MDFLVFLRGGPDPVGGKDDNRIITVPEAAPEIVISVEGGRQGKFRQTDDTVNAETGLPPYSTSWKSSDD